MRRLLLTGMSGVGKSSVLRRLTAAGLTTVDLDESPWSAWVTSHDGQGPSPLHPGQDWVWDEARVAELLARDEPGLVVGGTSPNQGRFHDRVDAVVLLSAPAEVMAERLGARTGYGSHPGEVARSLAFKESVEPLLRAAADHEIDTSPPLDDVVAAVLAIATSEPHRSEGAVR